VFLPAVLKRLAQTPVGDVVVVEGAYALDGVDVGEARVVRCPDWARGPGASLRCGLAALGDDVEAALIVLADGPELDPRAVERVIAHRAEAPVVLASSAKEEEVDHYLDLLDARELVDDWTTSADVEATKPEPDLVQAALAKAGAKDGVMVGDTTWDVEAAKKAGVETLAVLTGGFSAAELKDAGAIAVFESVRELCEKLDQTPLG